MKCFHSLSCHMGVKVKRREEKKKNRIMKTCKEEDEEKETHKQRTLNHCQLALSSLILLSIHSLTRTEDTSSFYLLLSRLSGHARTLHSFPFCIAAQTQACLADWDQNGHDQRPAVQAEVESQE
mmetsp:Transcript_37684/g.74110  ORF Transcript_37684/g.74110 Transcript_37684/m.74110 type:complete len:124 (+) Transcript_37684:654-1025(+)